MAGWRELFPERPDSALSDVGLLLLQRGLLECCPARQRETLGWFWMMKLRKEIGTTSMKSAKIWWNLTSSIDIRLHWSFFLNQLPRLEFMDPRRMAAEEAVEHPYFQEAQGSIKRLPYNVGLTGASSFFSSKCPWALGSSMDPCNMTYLGCCPPIGLAVWSFLKDFYPSEVHFGFKASETSLFY